MKKLTLACLVVAAGLPTLANAHKSGTIIVRTGAITVAPHESSDNVLGLGEFTVKDNTQLGLTATYMLTDNFAVELLAATPFSHRISLPGVGNLAKTRHLPPTLMAQYYLFNAENAWRPYLGVGVNYTNFFNEKFTNDVNGTLTDLKLSNSWGVAAQAGMDYTLANDLVVNASVWWMDIDTKAKFKAGGVQQKIKTKIDPWVFMFGVGYQF